jgi:hypothetical protein
MAYTLGQLVTLVRQRCDLENTTAQQDAEIKNHLNDAVSVVHDYLIATLKERYAVKSAIFNTVAGSRTYSLTASIPDIYRPVAVRVPFDNLSLPLDSFNPIDRIKVSTGLSWGPGALPRYAWVQNPDSTWVIEFDPPPDTIVTITLQYHPTAPTFTGNSTPVTIPYPDLVVVEAALRMKDKEDRDPQRLMAERELIKKRIEDWVGSLDMGATTMQTMRVRRQLSLGRRDRAF